jgi:ribosomal protein L37AE/L43A
MKFRKVKQNECQFILGGFAISYVADSTGKYSVVNGPSIRKKRTKVYCWNGGGALCPKCGEGLRKVAYEKLGIV